MTTSTTKRIANLVRALTACSLVATLGACAGASDDVTGSGDDSVVVDTTNSGNKAQYDANLAYIKSYVPRCNKPANGARPRVLVTGFGRFSYIKDNASGEIVARFVPGLTYPMTTPTPYGPDLPGPQTAVKLSKTVLPGAGAVDVCGMILPVDWDLAAILIAREVEAFEPTMVLMSGVDADDERLAIELGGVNAASDRDSSYLSPVNVDADTFFRATGYPKLIPPASDADRSMGLLLSFDAVQKAANKSIQDHANIKDQIGSRFGDALAQGAKLGGFPRAGGTFLCNNVAYTVNYLMSYPGKSVTLLQAATRSSSSPGARVTLTPGSGVDVKLTKNTRAVPRVFIHWPVKLLQTAHVGAAAAVVGAMVDAQLVALRDGTSLPTVGKNSMAQLPAIDGF